MDLPRDELDRLMFYEHALKQAAAEYKKSPKDADNLTRWGQALFELAHFRQGPDSLDMIEDAMSKFQEALRVDPKKHETYWCLGNALTSQGFLVADSDKANACFKEAAGYYQKALDVDPENKIYKNALEMTEKAPALHQDLQKQLAAQAALAASTPNQAPSGPVDASKAAKKKRKEYSDLKYDIIGWVVLTIGIFAYIGFSKAAAPPPPPPPPASSIYPRT